MKRMLLLLFLAFSIPLVSAEQDIDETIRAAESGDAIAQHNLGAVYHDGEGVPQNYSEAYVWFSLAAASGVKGSTHNRDVAAKKLSPEALATAQQRAAKLFKEIEARKDAQD